MSKIPRKESNEDAINKGMELMIRRAKRDSPYRLSRGLKINQTFVLFNKQLSFKLEFTWEDANTI